MMTPFLLVSFLLATALASPYTIDIYPTPVIHNRSITTSFTGGSNAYKYYYINYYDYSLNLLTSTDGLSWIPYAHNPVITGEQLGPSYGIVVKYYPASFTGANTGQNASRAPMHYRIWASIYNNYGRSVATKDQTFAKTLAMTRHRPRIYPPSPKWMYAESLDGINWHNIVNATEFGPVYPWTIPVDGVCMSMLAEFGETADVVYIPGASNAGTDWSFRMYYAVDALFFTNGTMCKLESCDACSSAGAIEGSSIAIAFSLDGRNWTGYSDVYPDFVAPTTVISPRVDSSSFDSDWIIQFNVLRDNATYWEAFYTGVAFESYTTGIGYATSIDGIAWSRDNLPIFFGNITYIPWFNVTDNEALIYSHIIVDDCYSISLWFDVIAGFYSDIFVGYTPLNRTDCAIGVGATANSVIGIVLFGIILGAMLVSVFFTMLITFIIYVAGDGKKA